MTQAPSPMHAPISGYDIESSCSSPAHSKAQPSCWQSLLSEDKLNYLLKAHSFETLLPR